MWEQEIRYIDPEDKFNELLDKLLDKAEDGEVSYESGTFKAHATFTTKDGKRSVKVERG